MCYKITVTTAQDLLEKRFDAKLTPDAELKPYFHANGFSNPNLPVISQEHPKEIELFEWGLIASFAKDSEHAKKLRLGTLNAKSETVFELASFKGSIRKRRCLVLADGFYESRKVAGKSYPYKIERKDKDPFALAGIYNYWKDENGIWHKTFSIMTTVPNQMMSVIHNEKLRMPVILPKDIERHWLDPNLLDAEITNLLQPLEDGILTAHTVDSRINQSKVFSNESWVTEVCEYPGVETFLQ